MINRATSRVPCNLNWTKVIQNRFKLHQTLELSHRKKFEKDYDYLGNIDLDTESLISFDHKEIRIVTSKDHASLLSGRKVDINSPELDDIRKKIGFVEYIGSIQNLEPNNFVPAHYDIPAEFVPEGTTPSLLTTYYQYLREKHEDFDEISVDHFFNIVVIFLEPWEHGQAFMIGRDSFTNWRVGDVIAFPWYMPHSTVNGSDKNRHLLYMAGSLR